MLKRTKADLKPQLRPMEVQVGLVKKEGHLPHFLQSYPCKKKKKKTFFMQQKSLSTIAEYFGFFCGEIEVLSHDMHRINHVFFFIQKRIVSKQLYSLLNN